VCNPKSHGLPGALLELTLRFLDFLGLRFGISIPSIVFRKLVRNIFIIVRFPVGKA